VRKIAYVIYGNTLTVAITNGELPSMKKSVEFYSGDFKR